MAGAGLAPGLRRQRKQTQRLTPAQQQSIRLLHLSGAGLDAAIREALETNPLLAPDETPAGTQDELARAAAPMPARDPAAGYRPPPAGLLFAAGTPSGAASRGAPSGTYRPDTYRNGAYSSDGYGTGGTGEADETGPAAPWTLQDALFEDIAFSFADARERAIAVDLTHLLDESGYLAGDPGEIAALRGVGTGEVQAILRRLQTLAPPGLFARSLGECLRLQLADAGRLDPRMDALLDRLPLLTERGPAALAAAAGIDPGELPHYLDRLRALDPRPGLALAGAAAPPAIVPDLVVRPADGAARCDGADRIGRWIVAVNPHAAPGIALDRAGFERLRARSRSRTDEAWLRDRAREAVWLVRAVARRRATILRLGVEIFRRQQEFLDRGMTRLRPLTRKDIARATDLHESTVCRAVNEKYAATPQGVIALKLLFSARIGALDGGPGHAAGAVRQRLRALFDREADVLSDEAATRLLRAEGYDLARRTVTKYRRMLRIPSSVERRRLRAGEKISPAS